jgi:nucleoside-diphosphate-sugar epimerase
MREVRQCSVAVVGGAGFLGSHLTDHLVEDRGCRVLVLDNLEAGRREFVHPKANFVWCDITQSERRLYQLFKEHSVYYVFNYAARPYVPDSYERPLRTFDVNAMGALAVMNAAQEAGVEGILQVSSAEVYGQAGVDGQGNRVEGMRMTEQWPVTPHSSYGAAKAAIDAAVQVRWREAKTPCIALRQFNAVGPRDCLHPYVVVEIMRQIHQGLSRTGGDRGYVYQVKLGNNSSRDFLYAGDAVRLAVLLLERGEFGEVYNLGSEESVKIYDLARLCGEVMGIKVEVQPDPARCRPWEIWSLRSDNTKLYRTLFGEEHRPHWGIPNGVGLREALRRTAAWFGEDGWRFPW